MWSSKQTVKRDQCFISVERLHPMKPSPKCMLCFQVRQCGSLTLYGVSLYLVWQILECWCVMSRSLLMATIKSTPICCPHPPCLPKKCPLTLYISHFYPNLATEWHHNIAYQKWSWQRSYNSGCDQVLDFDMDYRCRVTQGDGCVLQPPSVLPWRWWPHVL
jgi:hypothetical protein